jgi:glycosyltransferase involved in cell wall biosynthesis
MTTAVPAVSVLMTVYNREKYIETAIKGVLDSSFGDFELIIVDDCSTDRSVEIARDLTAGDERARVVVNERNLGDYNNRNRAARLAKGDYLKYVDADDYLYPQGLEILVGSMKRFPDAGYGLCSLDQDEHRPYPFQLSSSEAYRRHYFGPPLFHKAPLSSIISRRAFEAVGGFTGRQKIGDFEMWHRLSARFPVVLIGGGIVWYRIHDQQESSFDRTNPIQVVALAWEVTREQLSQPDCPLSASEVAAVSRWMRKRKVTLSLVKAARLRPFQLAEVLRLRTSIPMDSRQ